MKVTNDDQRADLSAIPAQALASDLEGCGCVIVTTSAPAYSPSENLLDYVAAKGVHNNLVVTMAADLGDPGIASYVSGTVLRVTGGKPVV